MATSLSPVLTLMLLVLSAGGFIYCLRGSYYLSKASGIIRNGKREKYGRASDLCMKALDAGLSESYMMAASSLLMQYGDREKARPVLERFLSSKKEKLRYHAEATLSQYYFMTGDPEKAIELAEDAERAGYSSRGLEINMLNYYLKAGRLDAFRSRLEEYDRKMPDVPALEDFRAVLHMAEGRFEEAGKTLFSLLGIWQPTFSDPYVHYAIIHMHYGERRKAIEMLERAKDMQYTNMSLYPAPLIMKMIGILNGDVAIPFMKAASENIMGLLNGVLPEYTENKEEASFPPEPDFSFYRTPGGRIRRHEGEISTDLNDEDEEWLRRHQ